MSSVVSISQGGSAEEMVSDALARLGGLEALVSGKTVLVKPNLGPWVVGAVPDYVNRWATTKIPVVVAVVRLLKDIGIQRVLVGDGGFIGYDVTAQLKESGMGEAVEKAGGEVIDLDRGEFKRVKLTEDTTAEVSRIALEADAIVSMPILKTHLWTGVSLGIKNLKGIISPQSKRDFHRKDVGLLLARLVGAVTPRLTIVDGLIGYEGLGPVVFGRPRKVGLVIAGTDPVAVDAVSARIMEHDPAQIEHIRVAAELGVGEIDLDKIEIRGASISEVKQPFDPSPLGAHHMIDALGVRGLRYFGWRPGDVGSECSGCIGNLNAALAALATDTKALTKKLDIVVGPRDLPPDLQENVLLCGACQAPNRKAGEFIPGCPPSIKDTYTALARLTLSRRGFVAALSKRMFRGQRTKSLPMWEQYKDVV